MILADCRWITAISPERRVYRPELGWTDAPLVETRRRSAGTGLLASAALALVALARGLDAADGGLSAGVVIAACAGILSWLATDRRLHHGRYTLICLGTLTMTVLLHEVGSLVVDDERSVDKLVGALASVFAAQLYVVAGIRKLQAPGFMSGRVLADNLAYGLFQGAAGHRDFPRVLDPHRLADLLESRTFLMTCRAASVATAGTEVIVGLGAAGLLPRGVTLALAVPMNLAFLLISPKRIVTFIVAAFGLLLLATADPLLPVFG